MATKLQHQLLSLQRMEATEGEIYRRLAKKQKNPSNKKILLQIAEEEGRHEAILAEATGQTVKPMMWKVWLHSQMAWIFGLTFAVKMLERVERDASTEYRKLGYDDLADEEDSHEERLIGLLEEGRLTYIGSVVLGMSDALIELTGALAGLTFAFGDLKLVALAGLVTGIAAAFSMGASEYLSTRSEKKDTNPLTAAFFTWIAYLLTVFLLVAPYLIISPDTTPVYGLEPHVLALVCTLIIGIVVIASFNFYVSVVEEVSFLHRFAEMAGLLFVVSLISFGIGILLSNWMGI
ncbi:MAG TPA: rubrerythrin family protein [Candidatus Poseidoniales archaeon]|nr:rubrerythrin family protein [Candidatus Poseidoniales archaeon]HIB41269.1 rubrerythrin family protein [Candidatus Poseidoniales archaeon]